LKITQPKPFFLPSLLLMGIVFVSTMEEYFDSRLLTNRQPCRALPPLSRCFFIWRFNAQGTLASPTFLLFANPLFPVYYRTWICQSFSVVGLPLCKIGGFSTCTTLLAHVSLERLILFCKPFLGLGAQFEIVPLWCGNYLIFFPTNVFFLPG